MKVSERLVQPEKPFLLTCGRARWSFSSPKSDAKNSCSSDIAILTARCFNEGAGWEKMRHNLISENPGLSKLYPNPLRYFSAEVGLKGNGGLRRTHIALSGG
mgnify:CR=1 FL=1